MSPDGANDPFRLDGQVAVVTGGARGLGQAMAVALAKAGAAVAVVDVLHAIDTLVMVRNLGVPHVGRLEDLSTFGPDDAKAMFASIAEIVGEPTILVNNAGIIRRGPALTHSWEDWQETITLDLSVPFLLSQALAQGLVARGQPGKIVNVASMLSYQGGYLVPGYAAAKSGVAGLTRALANEWASYGINVNAIAPGYMATELTAMLRSDPARAETMLARIPAGRWGEPDDLAGAVVFLCSQAAAYIHGTVLPVDGGWLAW
ncbi:MAG: SDR family oxidoreductase [Thermomicrobiales bacterium]